MTTINNLISHYQWNWFFEAHSMSMTRHSHRPNAQIMVENSIVFHGTSNATDNSITYYVMASKQHKQSIAKWACLATISIASKCHRKILSLSSYFYPWEYDISFVALLFHSFIGKMYSVQGALNIEDITTDNVKLVFDFDVCLKLLADLWTIKKWKISAKYFHIRIYSNTLPLV